MRLVPNILVLHSTDLEECLIAEAKATGMSKSAVARQAIDHGFARVMGMSRGRILSMTHNDTKMTNLPRVGAHLTFDTDRLIRSYAADLDIPVWRVYSLAIDAGLEHSSQLPLAQN